MPTRQILLSLGEDTLAVAGSIPTNGRFVATATQVRVNGASITLPVTLSRDIVAGDFSEDVFLEVTPQPYWWLWALVIRDEEDTVMLRRMVAVPPGTTDPIAFGDLPMIDPATLEPTADPEAAWWVAVQPFIDAYNAGELKGDQGDPGPPGGPGPEGPSAYDVAVSEGFVGTEAEWLDSLVGAQGDPGDTGPVGPSGRYQYADFAEFEAETTTRVGTVPGPPTNWGAATGLTTYNTLIGPALVETHVGTSSGTTIITQRMFIGSNGTLTTGVILSRRKSGASAFTAWTDRMRVVVPVDNADVTSKSYVDNRFTFSGVTSWANTAAFDAYDLDSAFGAIAGGISNMGTYTGIAALNGIFVGIPIAAHYLTFPSSGTGGAMRQTIEFVDLAGNERMVERSRTWASGSAPAWGPWELVAVGGVIKTYASTAEVDAVAATEQGVLRLPNQAALQAFFGAGGTDMFFGADVLIQSFLSDNYGSGFYPTASGQMQQIAWVTDGYNDNKKLSRYRSYNSGTSTWGPWGAWEVVPVPGFRPSATGLWQAAPAVDGGSDAWVPVLTAETTPTGGEAGAWSNIAQHWDAMFAAADQFALVGGRLQMKQTTFAFEGMLDAAKTDVGTVAFGPRNTGDLVRQTVHIDAVAAAAGVNAVAGFSLPLDIISRPGLMFHATFGMKAGMTAATRFLCGLVFTADLASAMADNEPSAVNNFFGAGYGSSDANVSAFQRATGALSTGASTAAVSTSANQLIDFKAWMGPNNNALYYILTVRNTGTIVRKQGALGSGLANSSALSFFIRASAGGTSATPQLALHRLRVGSGFGAVGGS